MDLCTVVADDINILMTERQRAAEDFRAQIASIGMLRGLLTEAPPGEAREQLKTAIEDEARKFHELANRLLHLEASVLAMQRRGANLAPLKEARYAARHL